MGVPVLITATLASGLGGHEPPKLDGLLERMLAHHCKEAVPSHAVDRSLPAPPQGVIPIPIPRRRLAGRVERAGEPPASGRWRYEEWLVGACSDPILGEVHDDRHEHVAKRIGTERAPLLAPGSRVVVATTNSWTKSHMLPIRVRRAECVRWFAVGDPRRILSALRRCHALGKKVSIGYGRVAEWSVERVEHDYSWFAPLPEDPTKLVLMRTLPVGPWLPMDNLVGYRRDFGACVPPYWHPARACDRIVPA